MLCVSVGMERERQRKDGEGWLVIKASLEDMKNMPCVCVVCIVRVNGVDGNRERQEKFWI